MAQITLVVDGASRTIEIDDPDMPLLYALRDELALNNPRFGCGLGQCGACTVQIDGRAVRSCVTPVSSVAGRKITTLAGIGTPEKPHPGAGRLDRGAGQPVRLLHQRLDPHRCRTARPQSQADRRADQGGASTT